MKVELCFDLLMIVNSLRMRVAHNLSSVLTASLSQILCMYTPFEGHSYASLI